MSLAYRMSPSTMKEPRKVTMAFHIATGNSGDMERDVVNSLLPRRFEEVQFEW